MLRRSTPMASRGMATTFSGMRRILKKPDLIPVHKYMKQAVQTGIYRSANPTMPPQPGNKLLEGMEDFPVEYQILQMHPPLPARPTPPRKWLKMQRQEALARSRGTLQAEADPLLPTDRLVQSYLQRHYQKATAKRTPSAAEREDQRKSRLFGVDASSQTNRASRMGRKSTLLNDAYRFALVQYELLRTQEAQDDPPLTEKQSIDMVDQMLAKEDEQERKRTREAAQAAQEWRQQQKAAAAAASKANISTEEAAPALEEGSSSSATLQSQAQAQAQTETSLPSILHSKPRTIRAMNIWASRLSAVPYSRWTIGATVALDHWIAADVLGMSEDTWEALLQGGGDNDDGDEMSLLPRGRDIIGVRGALFPETVLDSSLDNDDLAGTMDEEKEEEELDETEQSIDELLASLGGDFDFGGDSTSSLWASEDNKKKAGNVDQDIGTLVEELQTWRAKNLKLAYAQWDETSKKEFNTWMVEYISVLTTETDGDVDLENTRDRLLSGPPVSRDESAAFWDKVRDQTSAEIFLHGLLEKGVPAAQDEVVTKQYQTFLGLTYEVQLQKLVDLGTLRPLYDEYISEADRVTFMARYGETLLEGTMVEHLVKDSNGPISADELGPEYGTEFASKGDRFRIEMLPYGSDEFDVPRSERARLLFRAWNTHKAGRASYEEHLFKQGKLGLEYSNETKKERDKRKRKERYEEE